MNDTELRVRERFLVLRAQIGDLGAFDELLRSVQAPLHRYITHTISNADAADDILQNVFLIIYRKLGWLEDAGLFRAWAFRIASRETFRHMKRERKLLNEEQIETEYHDDGAAAVDESLITRESNEQILKMLDRVSDASRAVIVLHYLEEFTLNETAEILGISVGTAKSRLAYGLKLMRKHLGVKNESAADVV